LLLGVCVALVGCSGGGDAPARGAIAQPVTLVGSVGDGPITNADVQVLDAAQGVVVSTTSDDSARYQVVVPAGTRYPLTLVANGGIDLVTNRAPDFALQSFIDDPTQTVANLSPLSTFASHVAACLKGPRFNTGRAWGLVLSRLSMGFDAETLGHPARTPVDASNVTAVVLASEGLAEAVRRTRDALDQTSEPRSAAEVITGVACDLAADGEIDGNGTGASPRVAASFWAAEAGVLVEMIGKQLRVDGVDVKARLDEAAMVAVPAMVVTASTADVPVTTALIQQAREALAVLHRSFGDDLLARLAVLLDTVPVASLSTSLAQSLSAVDLDALADLPSRVAVADDATLTTSLALVHELETAARPLISFEVTPTDVAPGGTARLSWASAEVVGCFASGGWSGEQLASGTMLTAPLTAPVRYRLDCPGTGGTASAEVSVRVSGVAPAPAPTVSLTASTPSVVAGGNVALSWISTVATGCSASGAWTGTKATQGSQVVGPLNATSTFSLACSGPGGNAATTVNVTVTPVTPPPLTVTSSLKASPAWVDVGGSTRLDWTSGGATGCSASGSWSGSKPTSGSSIVGPISTDSTFSLTCSGAGGNALATAAASVRSARLSWQAPSTLSPATLSGFRIYYGTASGSYGQTVQIADLSARSHVVTLSPGTYFFSLAAVDAAGNVSGRSNEVSKTIE